MATYGIDGVRISASTDRVTHVRWAAIDPQTHDWLSQPKISEIAAVTQDIRSGAVVYSVFTLGGRRYLGPKIKPVPHPNGIDGIDMEVPDGSVEKSMDDLPRV
ncbi:hypothetical protein [Paraburkholderia unamae]|uniref:Uncharacterized protein n=1 Tax=Paraburkholderia unamae TaxID=219649 RepID=A0ABX5KHN5_9BURK|nr:hypothetical protein [Paraburkholderia unamae]PVX75626.1 hypothetical protein C7402_11738 [Paraburkholderia unamae]CAG9259658.1 conserved hypothetical protein [Paraburkholderia unamae]